MGGGVAAITDAGVVLIGGSTLLFIPEDSLKLERKSLFVISARDNSLLTRYLSETE